MGSLHRIGRRGAIAVVVALLCMFGTVAAASADGAEVYHLTLTGTDTFSGEVNPCNGETIAGTEGFTFATTLVSTSSGDSIRADMGTFHGTGVGSTGARYVFESVGLLNSDVFYAGPDRQVQIFLNPTIHFIRTGEDGTQEDFFFHATFTAIIDLETLTITHESSHFSTECR
jgi:hypothetical protein